METIAYLKNERDSRTYSISEDMTVEGHGRFWYNITSWAVDHGGQPGWYIIPLVADPKLLRAADILEKLKIGTAEG
ncbi:MAG: hypothetical protein KatS3mg015_2886 [Fimbriimonadales bacterium]|nr:MAG: hypothetical protein KatS3mg015_2886 [Fimbriimonadales bacterium]